MDLTDYMENRIIDNLLRAGTPNAYLALFTSATTDAGGGTEVTGGSYARQAVTLSPASGGATANTNAITFANMPAATVTHAALFDAVSGGNMLMHGALAAAKSIAAGGSITVAVGDVDVAFT